MTARSRIATVIGVVVGRGIVAALLTLVVVTISAVVLSISIVLGRRVTILGRRLVKALRPPVVVARIVVVVRRGIVRRLSVRRSVIAPAGVVVERGGVIPVTSAIVVVLRGSVVHGLVLVTTGLEGRRNCTAFHSPPGGRSTSGAGSKALLPRHFTAHDILSCVQHLSARLYDKLRT